MTWPLRGSLGAPPGGLPVAENEDMNLHKRGGPKEAAGVGVAKGSLDTMHLPRLSKDGRDDVGCNPCEVCASAAFTVVCDEHALSAYKR